MKVTFSLDQWRRVADVGTLASTDTCRPVLTAVYIEGADGKILVTATDSYRLNHTWWDQVYQEVEFDVLIPAKAIVETLRSFDVFQKIRPKPKPKAPPLPETHVELTITKDVTVRFKQANKTLAAHTITPIEPWNPDHKYPLWRSLVAEPDMSDVTPGDRVSVNPKFLTAMAKAAGLNPRDPYHPLTVQVIAEDRPVRFFSKADPNWIGLLMPVRTK